MPGRNANLDHLLPLMPEEIRKNLEGSGPQADIEAFKTAIRDANPTLLELTDLRRKLTEAEDRHMAEVAMVLEALAGSRMLAAKVVEYGSSSLSQLRRL